MSDCLFCTTKVPARRARTLFVAIFFGCCDVGIKHGASQNVILIVFGFHAHTPHRTPSPQHVRMHPRCRATLRHRRRDLFDGRDARWADDGITADRAVHGYRWELERTHSGGNHNGFRPPAHVKYYGGFQRARPWPRRTRTPSTWAWAWAFSSCNRVSGDGRWRSACASGDPCSHGISR